MKLIILNAGDAYELDGYNKLLIRHPEEQKTIIELYQEYFDVDTIEIVVGYKAIEIMNHYSQFNYIYNRNWQTTGSGYSLSLALSSEPCYVVPSDYIIDKKTVDLLSEHDNCALIKHTENKRLSSLNACLGSDGSIIKTYRGSSKNNDPELLGIFKITDSDLLRNWKKNCVVNTQNYAGENLPLNLNEKIISVASKGNTFEINTPEDYILFLKNLKS